MGAIVRAFCTDLGVYRTQTRFKLVLMYAALDPKAKGWVKGNVHIKHTVVGIEVDKTKIPLHSFPEQNDLGN
jgi:hypothetical protein